MMANGAVAAIRAGITRTQTMRFAQPLAVTALVATLGAAESGGMLTVPIGTQLTGTEFPYTVRAGDTFASIGARFGVDTSVLAAQNESNAKALLAPGVVVTVDNRHVIPAPADALHLVINVPQRMLFHYAGGVVRNAFPIAAGRPDWRTPLGDFVVLRREEHPTWEVPESIQEEMRRNGRRVITVMPPSPENPLGAYWIGLSLPSVGIHGTSVPNSIYKLATHGCMRLHPDDIETLFAAVSVGDRGRTIYEPVMLADTPGGLYLEAHRDSYRRVQGDTLTIVRETARAAGLEPCIDWTAAAAVLRARDGIARRVGVATAPPLNPSTTFPRLFYPSEHKAETFGWYACHALKSAWQR